MYITDAFIELAGYAAVYFYYTHTQDVVWRALLQTGPETLL